MTYQDPRYARDQTCVSCLESKPIQEFRGARSKAKTCKPCESAHPDLHWCVDCADWLPIIDFYLVGAKQKFQSNRCKPCLIHNAHGVTRQHMKELTGKSIAECSACGGDQRLSIDHDHAHCVGEHGCTVCVRGYLCGPCNTAEGLLKTPERVRALADYMERSQLDDETLSMPRANNRNNRVRERPPPKGRKRTYYVHR